MNFVSVGERLHQAFHLFGNREALPGITYERLGQAIEHSRQRLRERTKSGQCVALENQKFPAIYAMWLACWMEGRPTIFLSPSWGNLAREKILRTLDPAMVFSESELTFVEAPLQKPVTVQSTQTLYFIGTSGSTGEPKLIDVSQEALSAWIENSQPSWDVLPTDRVSQVFDLTFDPSISDVLWTFLSGACLIPFDLMGLINTPDWIDKHGITIWSSSPSQAQSLCLAREGSGLCLASLRRSTFIGEILTKKFAQAWQRIAPCSTIENHYGPAEAVISVSHDVISDPSTAPDEILSIGAPFPGVMFETDTDGTLIIRSQQVAKGYVGLDSPLFKVENGHRSYRSGDCAQMTPYGKWKITGRADHQIKIHGQRWESEGIESCLEKFLKTPLCIIKYQDDRNDGLDLILLGEPTVDVEQALDQAFTEVLPVSLRPRFIWIRPSPPLTVSGKIDRSLLKEEMQKGALKKYGS